MGLILETRSKFSSFFGSVAYGKAATPLGFADVLSKGLDSTMKDLHRRFRRRGNDSNYTFGEKNGGRILCGHTQGDDQNRNTQWLR